MLFAGSHGRVDRAVGGLDQGAVGQAQAALGHPAAEGGVAHVQQVAVLKAFVDALGGRATRGLGHEAAHGAQPARPVDEAGVALPVGGRVLRKHARLPVGVQQVEQMGAALAQSGRQGPGGALAQLLLGVGQVRLDAQRVGRFGRRAPAEAGHEAGVAHHGVHRRQGPQGCGGPRPGAGGQVEAQPAQPHQRNSYQKQREYGTAHKQVKWWGRRGMAQATAFSRCPQNRRRLPGPRCRDGAGSQNPAPAGR